MKTRSSLTPLVVVDVIELIKNHNPISIDFINMKICSKYGYMNLPDIISHIRRDLGYNIGRYEDESDIIPTKKTSYYVLLCDDLGNIKLPLSYIQDIVNMNNKKGFAKQIVWTVYKKDERKYVYKNIDESIEYNLYRGEE